MTAREFQIPRPLLLTTQRLLYKDSRRRKVVGANRVDDELEIKKKKMARCRRRSSLALAATAALLLLIFAASTTTMAAPSSSNAAAPAPAAATAAAAASKGTTAATAPKPSSSTPAVADVDAVVGSSASSASSASSSSSSNPWPPEVVRALKKTVVNIDLATPVALVDDKRTAATGTGFVVDAARGLVVTNRHISTVSPTVYQVRFNDGSFAPARCVYYDVAQDFAVLKVDASETTYNLTQVELGTAESLRVGDAVLIIGNNEGYVFSAIEGVVSDLRALSDTAGVRPSLDIETTFDSSSGSSGSPVW